ncbi:MAG: FHA domain-containing protein [Mariniblastus sp.]
MLDVKLVVVGGDAKSAEVQLKLPTIIGRGKEVGLTVPHALVSRRHTEIFEEDGGLFVKDLGSLNGTFVNNLRIETAQPLEPNQLLTLGNITFRAVYEKQNTSDTAGEASRETVTFEEVNTTEEFAKKSKNGSEITFDKTVPVGSLGLPDSNSDAEQESVKPSKSVEPKSKTESKPQPVEEPAAIDQSSVSSASDADDGKGDVHVELEEKGKSSAADTDKSFISEPTKSDASDVGSSIFSFADSENSAEKSVSASSLDDLPTGGSPAVSFVGGIDLGEEAVVPASSQIDPIEINLGEEAGNPSKVEQDSTLGSFLKKLPR